MRGERRGLGSLGCDFVHSRLFPVALFFQLSLARGWVASLVAADTAVSVPFLIGFPDDSCFYFLGSAWSITCGRSRQSLPWLRLHSLCPRM